MAFHNSSECFPIDGRIGAHTAVERRSRCHCIGALTRNHQRESTAHTKTRDTNFGIACALLQQINRTAEVFSCRCEIHAHQQLARTVWFCCHFTVIQIRCQRSETFSSKSISNVFDVIIQTPPLLDDHHTRAAVSSNVSRASSTVALELDHLAHQYAPPSLLWSHVTTRSISIAIPMRFSACFRMNPIAASLAAPGPLYFTETSAPIRTISS